MKNLTARHLTALRALLREYEAGDGYYTGHEDEDAILAVRKRNLRAGKELLESLAHEHKVKLTLNKALKETQE